MNYCWSGILSSESGASILDNSSISLLSPCHDLTRKWNFPRESSAFCHQNISGPEPGIGLD